MGGNGQAMFHVQVLTNVLDYGLDMQEAIERPRFLDRRVPARRARRRHPRGAAACRPRVLAALRPAKAIASRRRRALFYEVGHAHGIAVRDGTLMGGADPRGDGVALGF